MTKEPYSAYHGYLLKCSVLSPPHITQRELLRRRSGKGKRQHLWIRRRALIFPPPGSHCHLLKEARDQAPMPHSTPQPFRVSGHLFPCAQPAHQAGLMDLLMRPSKVFFFLVLGWGKSNLAPTAVVGSDQFNSHANYSGVSITGEL